MLIGLTALILFSSSIPACDVHAAALVDMAGRQVELPANVRSVATIGSVPVLNSLVFAAGAGNRIVNGLSGNLDGPMWKYQEIFSPGMSGRPVLQNGARTPDLEAIMKAQPDAVLTMDLGTVAAMERIGIPVLYLSWKDPDDVKKAVMIVAALFGRSEIGKEYARYFDDVLERIRTRLRSLPESRRPGVLYCSSLKDMTQPHLIVEWWIEAAGGRSVTSDGRKAENLSYSLEKVLLWNPDVLLLPDMKEVGNAYADQRLKTIKAVANGKVYASPVAAHLWAHRTAEQPLMVLWAAKKFFPDEFADLDLESEMHDFYLKFFGYQMSRSEAKKILKGFTP